PRRDVPVDGPHVVADLVGADLRELDAAPAEGRVVLPPEHVLDEPLRADLDVADLLEKLAGDHGGGGWGRENGPGAGARARQGRRSTSVASTRVTRRRAWASRFAEPAVSSPHHAGP